MLDKTETKTRDGFPDVDKATRAKWTKTYQRRQGANFARKTKCASAVATHFSAYYRSEYLQTIFDLCRAVQAQGYAITEEEIIRTGRTAFRVGETRRYVKALRRMEGSFILRVEDGRRDGHFIILDTDGTTLVDTSPRKRDGRRVTHLYYVSGVCGNTAPKPEKKKSKKKPAKKKAKAKRADAPQELPETQRALLSKIRNARRYRRAKRDTAVAMKTRCGKFVFVRAHRRTVNGLVAAGHVKVEATLKDGRLRVFVVPAPTQQLNEIVAREGRTNNLQEPVRRTRKNKQLAEDKEQPPKREPVGDESTGDPYLDKILNDLDAQNDPARRTVRTITEPVFPENEGMEIEVVEIEAAADAAKTLTELRKGTTHKGAPETIVDSLAEKMNNEISDAVVRDEMDELLDAAIGEPFNPTQKQLDKAAKHNADALARLNTPAPDAKADAETLANLGTVAVREETDAELAADIQARVDAATTPTDGDRVAQRTETRLAKFKRVGASVFYHDNRAARLFYGMTKRKIKDGVPSTEVYIVDPIGTSLYLLDSEDLDDMTASEFLAALAMKGDEAEEATRE